MNWTLAGEFTAKRCLSRKVRENPDLIDKNSLSHHTNILDRWLGYEGGRLDQEIRRQHKYEAYWKHIHEVRSQAGKLGAAVRWGKPLPEKLEPEEIVRRVLASVVIKIRAKTSFETLKKASVHARTTEQI